MRIAVLVKLGGIWQLRSSRPPLWFSTEWFHDYLFREQMTTFSISANAITRIVTVESAREDYDVQVRP